MNKSECTVLWEEAQRFNGDLARHYETLNSALRKGGFVNVTILERMGKAQATLYAAVDILYENHQSDKRLTAEQWTEAEKAVMAFSDTLLDVSQELPPDSCHLDLLQNMGRCHEHMAMRLEKLQNAQDRSQKNGAATLN